jgi:hypothetical protein
MSTIASAQRIRTAALIAATLAAVAACSESGSTTAPNATPGTSDAPSIASSPKPTLGGYALASGRVDTLRTPSK